MTENVRSTPCPDCQGTGSCNRMPCQRCGGIGKLYKLASSSTASSGGGGDESDSWISAAVIATALGKDPLDAAVIAAITGSAPLGIVLAGEQDRGETRGQEVDPPTGDAAGADSSAGNGDDASPSDDPNGDSES